MEYNPDHILIICPSPWNLSWWLLQKHLLWNSLESLASLDGLCDCWKGSLHLHATQGLVGYYLPRLPTLGTIFVMNQLPNKYLKRNWNMLWSQFPDTNTKRGSPWPTQLLLHCQTERHPMQRSRGGSYSTHSCIFTGNSLAWPKISKPWQIQFIPWSSTFTGALILTRTLFLNLISSVKTNSIWFS